MNKEKTMRNAVMEMLQHDRMPVEGRVFKALKYTAREPRSRTLEVLFEENPDVPKSTLEHILNILMFKIASGDVQIREYLRQIGAVHFQKDCARKIMEH